jgi:hypothetical protein
MRTGPVQLTLAKSLTLTSELAEGVGEERVVAERPRRVMSGASMIVVDCGVFVVMWSGVLVDGESRLKMKLDFDESCVQVMRRRKQEEH